MSSSEDDDFIALYSYYRNRKNKKRRYWIHPYIQKNVDCHIFVAVNKLMQDNVKFQSFYHMSKECFNILVEKVGQAIEKNKTHISVVVYVYMKV